MLKAKKVGHTNVDASESTYLEKNWYGKYKTEKIPSDYKTKNEVIGKIDRPKKSVNNAGVYPNFKKAKLEDLLDDLKTFFFQIQKFTDDMRAFAAGALKEIDEVIKYIDGKINRVGSYGDKFIDQSLGPLELSFGKFDEDNIEDIFILSNGPNPEGYFIFSDASEEANSLNNYPRLRFLHQKGVDLNFDGVDDILMINRSGGIMSNIWGSESIVLSDSNIQDIKISLGNGLIYLNTVLSTPLYLGLLTTSLYSLLPFLLYFILRFFEEWRFNDFLSAFLVMALAVARPAAFSLGCVRAG